MRLATSVLSRHVFATLYFHQLTKKFTQAENFLGVCHPFFAYAPKQEFTDEKHSILLDTFFQPLK